MGSDECTIPVIAHFIVDDSEIVERDYTYSTIQAVTFADLLITGFGVSIEDLQFSQSKQNKC